MKLVHLLFLAMTVMAWQACETRQLGPSDTLRRARVVSLTDFSGKKCAPLQRRRFEAGLRIAAEDQSAWSRVCKCGSWTLKGLKKQLSRLNAIGRGNARHVEYAELATFSSAVRFPGPKQLDPYRGAIDEVAVIVSSTPSTELWLGRYIKATREPAFTAVLLPGNPFGLISGDCRDARGEAGVIHAF